MRKPTPAIVAQSAVMRLPRPALWLFCMAYVLPGFLGRVPWKRADITAFGYMAELARGGSDWWMPTMGGQAPDVDALLPYWLGAWAIQGAPQWLPADLAVRFPFMGLLLATLVTVWYATYYLAHSPMAQPVPFAFGGEAHPADYAHAVADGGLLALIACLGLAQISHETTPALAQLGSTALLFYAAAALPYRWLTAAISATVGSLGLALSGAPSLAVMLGLGCAVIYLPDRRDRFDRPVRQAMHSYIRTGGFVALACLTALCAGYLHLWRWRIDLPQATWAEWQSLGRLFLWFTWPTWPFAIWTLWRWRLQMLDSHQTGRHLWLPVWFVGVAGVATLVTESADRSLLLALPALATLAAFALPTLGRSLGALIDWFTLLFFSGCALIIWVVWLSMQTGFPAQPAANVARLAPGFEHSLTAVPLVTAVIATLTWAGLVKWRIGRHRTALWKSVVLPAGGAALCWLLLMTLWLPLLDFARSYAPMVQHAQTIMQSRPHCIETLGLQRSQYAALRFHGNLTLVPMQATAISTFTCPWLIVGNDFVGHDAVNTRPYPQIGPDWVWQASVQHPSDPSEALQLYSRATPPMMKPAL